VIFHFKINFTGELFTATERVELLYALLLIAAAITVTVVWGPEKLTREQVSLGAVKKPLSS